MNEQTQKHYDAEAGKFMDNYYGKTPIMPHNKVRVDIILKRFKEIGAKVVVDAGCGSGYPMIRMLDEGMEAYGFDISIKMLEECRRNILKAGYYPNILFMDLEEGIPFNDVRTEAEKNPGREGKGFGSMKFKDFGSMEFKGFGSMEFDAMMMHGPLSHAIDDKRLLTNASCMLKDGGTIMCEARNELMSVFSMNEYTQRFFLKMIEADKLPDVLRGKVEEFYSKFKGSGELSPWKVPYPINMHNPLTIRDLFKECGFIVKKLHFSHYHCLPPMFEKENPKLYRELSLKFESVDDWRGYFMASTFLVEAVRG